MSGKRFPIHLHHHLFFSYQEKFPPPSKRTYTSIRTVIIQICVIVMTSVQLHGSLEINQHPYESMKRKKKRIQY